MCYIIPYLLHNVNIMLVNMWKSYITSELTNPRRVRRLAGVSPDETGLSVDELLEVPSGHMPDPCLEGDVVRQPLAGVLSAARDQPDMHVRQRLTGIRAEIHAQVEVGSEHSACTSTQPERAPQERELPREAHLVRVWHDLKCSRNALAVFHNQIRPS